MDRSNPGGNGGGRPPADGAGPGPVPAARWTALRPHQWTKNLLVFVPLLASHRLFEVGLLRRSFVAFLAFCAAASAVYLVNDVVDRSSDRAHPRKSRRPVAGGSIPPAIAIALGCVLATAALLASGLLGLLPAAGIGGYLLLNLAYSLRLKRALLVDVFALASMHVWRMVVGGWVAGIHLTSWLLGFSAFLFLSLALAKRYAEVARLADRGLDSVRGRAWESRDAEALRAAGIASGVGGAVVLALYVQGESFTLLYRNATVAMLLVPLYLHWIIRMWIRAGRLELDEDPLLFAVRDPGSWTALLLALAILVSAMV
jgi:4-hydroxybenzoate polyprenyltransferase